MNPRSTHLNIMLGAASLIVASILMSCSNQSDADTASLSSHSQSASYSESDLYLRRSAVKMALNRAETNVNERPDSALALLRRIDPERLHGRENNARYALVKTMALYRKDSVMTDDSLIKVAAGYYVNRRMADRKPKYAVLTLFHWGNVLYKAKDYPHALINYRDAERLIDRVDDDRLSGSLYMALGDIYKVFREHSKSRNAYSKAYYYYVSAGNELEALEYLKKSYEIEDSAIRDLLDNPAMTAYNEIMEERAELSEYRLWQNRRLFLAVGIALALLVIIIILYVRGRIAAKNRQIDDYIAFAKSLQEIISDRDSQLSDITEQKNTLDTQVGQMSASIAELFSKQFKMFDEFLNLHYERASFGGDKDAVYERLKAEISKFSKDEDMIRELEGIINRYKRGVISLIRTEVGGLSERDMRLLCYVYAGFSAKSMSVLTGESVSNVLTRKSRLRQKIKDRNPAHLEVILAEMP